MPPAWANPFDERMSGDRVDSKILGELFRRFRLSRRFAAASFPLLASLLLGCGGLDRRADGSLLVLAASDLQFALPEIAGEFEMATGRRIQIVLGSTGNLTTQIEQGAPADVFLSANEGFLDRLDAAGLIDPGTRRVYGIGRIAAVWSADQPGVSTLDELREPRFRTLAIANPEHAPYGMAAREALRSTGVWTSVEPRLVLAENVAQAFQFVRSGNADAGIVALAVAMGVPGTPLLLVDADLHQPIRQSGAVLRDARDPFLAEEFLDFVTGDRGREILQRYGFEDP